MRGADCKQPGADDCQGQLAELRQRLAEANTQAAYYRRLAADSGRQRLRDVQLLSDVVDAHRQMEEALEAEQQRLLSIFDSLDETVYVSDPDSYEVLYANRRARDLFGDIVGKRCHKALYGFEGPCSSCPNDHILGENQGTTHTREEHNALTQSWYRCIARALRWPDGRTVRYEIGIDITESRKLEERVLLNQKMDSIGLLAGGIAHDFNNILIGAMGNVSLLALGEHDEESALLLGEVSKACDQAKALSNQLLTFSQGGSPVREPTLLRRLLEDTVNFVLHGSNVVSIHDFAPDLNRAVLDRSQMGQVIQNIVINAIQAMPRGGTIRVSATNVSVDPSMLLPLEPGHYVRLAFSDNGPGICPEHLQRIFDPYFTTKPSGHGLGLATSYSIVKKHGGHIEVASEVGKGTTFELYLPASEEGELVEPTEKPAAAAKGGKARVLMVDDEDIVLTVGTKMLKLSGYAAPAVAHDGEEAIRLCKEALAEGVPFTVAIMDLTIPGGMGGNEAFRRLRDLDPDLVGIVSSGYSNDPIMANHEAYGFAAVLPKPYRLAELRRAVERAVST